jgi:hypothetical protein
MTRFNILTLGLGSAATVAPMFLPFIGDHHAALASAIIAAVNALYHLYQQPPR